MEKGEKMKTVTTHNGVMHADEVAACALIKLFIDDEIKVKRVPHNTVELPKSDFIIDIGREFDGETKFDHHQNKGGKASAGLIWNYIGLEDRYEKISILIEKIDKHDTGIEKSGDFEVPAIISTFNSQNIYDPEQDQNFLKAIDFLYMIFASYKQEADEFIKAKKICEESQIFEGIKDVIEIKEFTLHWSKFINGEKMSNIEAVVWWDPAQERWKAQTTPKTYGSFKANGKLFLPDETMDFVHQAGFFAVAKNRETMVNFLKNSRK